MAPTSFNMKTMQCTNCTKPQQTYRSHSDRPWRAFTARMHESDADSPGTSRCRAACPLCSLFPGDVDMRYRQCYLSSVSSATPEVISRGNERGSILLRLSGQRPGLWMGTPPQQSCTSRAPKFTNRACVTFISWPSDLL